MEYQKRILKLIKSEMKKQKVSQTRLSEISGVHTVTISRMIRHGAGLNSLTNVTQILKALNIPAQYLYDHDHK